MNTDKGNGEKGRHGRKKKNSPPPLPIVLYSGDSNVVCGIANIDVD